MLKRLFIDHPRTVDESYGEHLRAASGFGFAMLFGGFACLIHAIVPGLFVHTGSNVIRGLHERMVVNRRRKRPAEEVIATAPHRT